MALAAKSVITAYYASAPRYAYWNGCSAGGRQAMKEAQRFPRDFDGIIAGAPGLDWTGRAVSALRMAQHIENNPAGQLLQEQRELVAAAALNACDADDGVVDGVIGQPAQCQFDPSTLACGYSSRRACLNPQQVATVNMLYSSPQNPASGRPITGLLPGSELGWTDLGWTGSARATGLDQMRYLIYGDADWSIERFDFDTDIAAAERIDNDTLNALDPDLGEFIAAGGKLIQYHGWSDPQISPANSTQYYERVTAQLGGRDAVHDAYRLFMAPGMGHCGGGNGPDTFDMVSALEAWVEQDQAPDRIIATGESNGEEVTRPLCPYPEIAVYRGRGDSNNIANYSCRLPDPDQ
jgi:feruloyl esterase